MLDRIYLFEPSRFLKQNNRRVK